MNRLPFDDDSREPHRDVEIEIPEHLMELLHIRFREAHGREAEDEKELVTYMLLSYLLNPEVRQAMKETAARPPEERAAIENYLDRLAREAVARGSTRPVDPDLHRSISDVLDQARKLEEN